MILMINGKKWFYDKKNLLFLSITLLNFWIWRILKENLFLGIILIALSIGLYYLDNNAKINPKLLLIVIILLIITTSITFYYGFDKSLFFNEPEEKILQGKRHSYLSSELGFVFKNKISLNYYVNIYPAISNLQYNLSYALNPNLYFFANHPRETANIEESEKYLFIFAPFFIIGFLHIIFMKKLPIIIYIIGAAFISLFVSPNFFLGPILFFPFINLVIYLGILKCFQFVTTFKQNQRNFI